MARVLQQPPAGGALLPPVALKPQLLVVPPRPLFLRGATLRVNRSHFISAAAASPPRPRPDESPATSLKPMPRRVEGLADDPKLANPLQRMERLGTGWMGVILELEGVCIEWPDYGNLGLRAWEQLAQEQGKSPPPKWALARAEGMKNEQAIQEVFCWTRDPMAVRRLALRKEEILSELLGDRKPMVPPGVMQLLETLQKNDVPVALVSASPESRVKEALELAGMATQFEVVVTAEDVYRGRPDPEGYLFAAQRIGRPPARCVVVGNSNHSIEAAQEAGMKCVALAGRHPVYELTAADLVVRSLGEIAFVNLKQLFRLEEQRLPEGDDEGSGLEEEEEDYDDDLPLTGVAVMDRCTVLTWGDG